MKCKGAMVMMFLSKYPVLMTSALSSAGLFPWLPLHLLFQQPFYYIEDGNQH